MNLRKKLFANNLEQFIRKEDDEEEAMLFLPNNLAALQSEIKSIEILE